MFAGKLLHILHVKLGLELKQMHTHTHTHTHTHAKTKMLMEDVGGCGESEGVNGRCGESEGDNGGCGGLTWSSGTFKSNLVQ